ncbi:hypothetical protein [Methylotenera sp.]|uniref:hypothetical protein n=1 Tax=Methylotenera sp. TaxID=2051956 RepID=UPI0025F4F466|nr:hypothetical protein [Methylotenera sp.]
MIKMSRSLRGPMKPRVLTTVALYEVVAKHFPNIKISSFYERIGDLVAIGDIKRVYKGLYINTQAIPKVTAGEVAKEIAPGSVVSLHSALSQAGVINNPSRVVTLVIPVNPRGWKQGDRSEIVTDIGDYWLFRMPERFVHCSGLADSDVFVQTTNYPLATAEKAFADWLYMGTGRSSRFSTLPPLDIELEKMSIQRMRRIVKFMGIEHALDDWLTVKKEYDNSENVRMNMSADMGY